MIRGDGKARHRLRPIAGHGWGILTQVTLPGGGKLGVYQPRHARPAMRAVVAKKKRRPRRAVRKAVKRPKNIARKAAKRSR